MGQLIIYFLIGLFFYWVYQSYRRYQQQFYSTKQFAHSKISAEAIAQSELGIFIALMAKVAKADGHIHELEAELLSNTFTDISRVYPQPDKVRDILKEIFNLEKQTTNNIDNLCLSLQHLTQQNPQKRMMMLTFLINLAYIDGELSHNEESMILKIAAFLHINSGQVDALMQRFASMYKAAPPRSTLNEAYNLLGATEDETMQSIKKKYRTLVKKYHPDMMSAKGASEDYIRDATQKMQAINSAYEMIKKTKG